MANTFKDLDKTERTERGQQAYDILLKDIEDDDRTELLVTRFLAILANHRTDEIEALNTITGAIRYNDHLSWAMERLEEENEHQPMNNHSN